MRVLLVRADGVGDALACAPLVVALQAAGHAVSAVLGTRNRAIFARETFERVHVLERIPWPAHGSTPQSRRKALAHARAAHYDVALIASEEIEAYTFACEAGIARRVGFINGWEKPLKTAWVRALLSRAVVRPAAATRTREHEVATLFALGAGLVVEGAPTRDVARLRAAVLDPFEGEVAGAPATRGAIAVQVSEKFADAGLTAGAFVALARTLRAAGRAVCVLGDDERLVRATALASGACALPGLDVVAWKTQVAAAQALVTADSGAAHVAGMCGVPVVDCFAPGPATAHDIARWSPWAAPFRAVVLDPTRSAHDCGALLADALDDLLRRGANDGGARASGDANAAAR